MKPITAAELSRRRKDDFEFLVLCESKGKPGMYQMLRDRELDDYIHVGPGQAPVPLMPETCPYDEWTSSKDVA